MSLSVFLIPIAIAGISAGTGQLLKVDVVTDVDETVLDEHKTYYKIETKIKDEQLLQVTLQNYGSETSKKENYIDSFIGDVQVTFYKEENETFSAIFHEEIDVTDAEQFVDNVFQEYMRVVQQKTYETLMERANNEGLIFESENHQEDSIVLTFQVKE